MSLRQAIDVLATDTARIECFIIALREPEDELEAAIDACRAWGLRI